MAPRKKDIKIVDYGSVSLDEESAPLQVSNHVEEEPLKKKRCRKPLILLSLLGLAAAFFVVSHFFQRTAAEDEDNEDDLPLVAVSPVYMGLLTTERAKDASPSVIWGNRTHEPLPTNSWYLNLVSHRAAEQPDESSRVYTVPYIVDTAPANNLAGIRVHWPVVSASSNNIQMVDDWKNGISLGSLETNQKYTVAEGPLSLLGVRLQWSTNDKQKKMVSPIVRGMPYATMQYHGGILPTLYSYNGPASSTDAIIGDGDKELKCGILKGKAGAIVQIESHVELHFINSDFKWGVFFSKPVRVKCDVTEGEDPKTREFQLQVVRYTQDEDEPLTVRLALLDQCTTGQSNIQSHCVEKEKFKDQDKYEQLLKDAAGVVPTNPQINFTYNDDESLETALVTIDWDAQSTTGGGKDDKLIMFAMPHHQETLDDSVVITDQCIPTFHGSTCLVKGDTWTLTEDLGRPMSFTARRPPEPSTIPVLAEALSNDIHYKLSDNMHRGAADTYFSGKILARLGRVIVIASELKALAAGMASPTHVKGVYDDVDDESLALSMEAAASEELPSDEEIAAAVEELKQGVEIWLTEQAEAPYIYDMSWGGLVNCGCTYHGKGATGICNNTFPDCPALADVNEDFGNGWYNDHHYHYGYHVSAAAVVSKYDPVWAEKFFDRVLLYIRDFANPSHDDEYFTQFRQKDWFLGSSWASGIISGENSPHGRNEESSSEAIAAYEAVALYGSVMMDVFRGSLNGGNFQTAKQIRNAGQLLTATELRATNRYWHVWSSATHNNTYPAAYQQPVVGMLYDTMASFQTWFAPYPLVSYGIQIMPLTPVAEQRDDPEWAAELYPLYDESCKTVGDFCINNGWSILQAGLCATVGNREEAIKQALAVPTKVFASDGGVGNSLTNTIWFIGTRKDFNGNITSTSVNATS